MEVEKKKLSRAEQARINGSKSRGPVTAAGKARSALNAVTSGMAAASPVLLTDDSRREFLAHRQAYLQRFQPTDEVEVNIITNIADAYWNLSRYTGFQSSLEMIEFETRREYWLKHYSGLNVALQQAMAFDSIANSSKTPGLLLRYMGHWQRVINNSLRNLQELRAKCPPAPGTILGSATLNEDEHLPELERSGAYLPSQRNAPLSEEFVRSQPKPRYYETNQTVDENKGLPCLMPNPTEPAELGQTEENSDRSPVEEPAAVPEAEETLKTPATRSYWSQFELDDDPETSDGDDLVPAGDVWEDLE